MLLYLYPDVNYLLFSIKSSSEPSIKIALDVIKHYMQSNQYALNFIRFNIG